MFRVPADPYRVCNIFLKKTRTNQIFILVSMGILRLSE